MTKNTKSLILYFHQSQIESLGIIRAMPDLKIGFEGDYFYVKGFEKTDDLAVKIAGLSPKESFEVDEFGNLFPIGKSTPVRKLPKLEWQSIRTILTIEPPVSILGGKTPKPIFAKLTPAKNIQKGTVLKTDLSLWKYFAETSAAIRLEKLQFAVSEKREVLIWGTPLPPIPGQEFWATKDNLIPCGYEFELALSAELIQQKYNPSQDEVLLFDKAGNWERIPKRVFVTGSRSGVRMTEV